MFFLQGIKVMNDTIKLTGTNIAIMLLIFIAVISVTLLVGKMFKKCCTYAFLNNIKIFSLLNIGVFALPFVLAGIMIHYRFKFLTLPLLIAIFAVCIIIPIIVNIYKMGFLYGFSISCFRLIAGSFGFALVFGIFMILGMVIIIGFCTLEAVFEKTVNVVTTNGEILNLAKTSSGLLVDVGTGNTYYSFGNNMLHCNDTGENLYF